MSRILALLICLGVSLAACSGDTTPPATEHPELAPFYRDYVDKYLSSPATGDKHREMLSDYWISDGEWTELIGDFLTCMEVHGSQGAIPIDSMVLNVSPARQEQINKDYGAAAREQLDEEIELALECGQNTIDFVGNIYFEPRINPDGVPYI